MLTSEASKRLGEQFKIPVAEGQLLNVSKISSAIIAREAQAFFAQESMRILNENVNKRVELVKNLVEEGKNEYQIAKELFESCAGDLKLLKIVVQKSVQLKYIPQENTVLLNVEKIINKNTATNNFANAYSKATDAATLAEDLSVQMLKIFTGNLYKHKEWIDNKEPIQIQ